MQFKSLGLLVVLVVVLVGSASLFTVSQVERGLLLRLGKLVDDAATGEAKIYQPGLHFKLPFVTQVARLDTRYQTIEVGDARIMTSEQKEVIVSYYIKYFIQNFPIYYNATNSGDRAIAQRLLSAKAEDGLRGQFGTRTIADIGTGGREDIIDTLRVEVDDSARPLGMVVVDVRIKRIDLPNEVSESVYERMRTAREQVAAEHRAAGLREAEIIRANTDAEVVVIEAEADRTAKNLRGDGDREASTIYANAYGQNPQFYSFYRSLLAYQESFNDKDDMLVLSPDSEFFRYFQNAGGAVGN